MMKVPSGIKSWVIPSFVDIFIVSGVDVACGVKGTGISVGARDGVATICGVDVGEICGAAVGAG
jgi:hypothetical protein